MKTIDHILAQYSKYYEDSSFEPLLLGTGQCPIPRFQEDNLIYLANQAKDHFSSQNTMLNINGDICVVGDIHGNLRDLIRILQKNGSPSKKKYLFLGDYVDRGEYSLEVVTLLFALTLLYPANIFLIRGNHEFEEVNSTYGFKDELCKEYPSGELYQAINDAFAYLPFAALVNKRIFAVHGGISQRLQSIYDIELIQRPLKTYTNPSAQGLLACDLVWSDPDPTIDLFGPSSRGGGHLFGKIALISFINDNKLKCIIRGHQMVNGLEYKFDRRLITVFSSSNYKPVFPNDLGLMVIHSDNNMVPIILPPLKRSRRIESAFVTVSVEPHFERLHSIKLQVGSPLKDFSHRRRIVTSKLRLSSERSMPIIPMQVPKIISHNSNDKVRRLSSISEAVLPSLKPLDEVYSERSSDDSILNLGSTV